jgi:hypothetical protein
MPWLPESQILIFFWFWLRRIIFALVSFVQEINIDYKITFHWTWWQVYFFGLLIVNFTGSKKKSPQNQSRNTCKSFLSKITLRFFCSSKFLDEKNASEKKWKLIVKVRRVQWGFFPEILRKFDNFLPHLEFFNWFLKVLSIKFFFLGGIWAGSWRLKKETGWANNSLSELEFEWVLVLLLAIFSSADWVEIVWRALEKKTRIKVEAFSDGSSFRAFN